MKTIKVVFVILGFSLSLTHRSIAQTPPVQTTKTDAQQTVSALLAGLGPIPYTHQVVAYRPCFTHGEGGRPIAQICSFQQTVTTSSLLSASDITVVSRTDIQFGQAMYTDFPSDLSADFALVTNCNPPPSTSQTQLPTAHVALSTTISRTTGVQVSQSFTHGGSTSVGFSIGPKDVGSLTGSVTVTDSATTGTATTTTDATQITQGMTQDWPEPCREINTVLTASSEFSAVRWYFEGLGTQTAAVATPDELPWRQQA
jgi:hypothetical protein